MPHLLKGESLRFILGRLAQALVLVVIVATVVFLIVRLTGNPLDVVADPRATEETRQLIAEKLGLDEPLIVQYGIYMTNLARGDFGTSFISQESCLKLFMQRLPATLELTVAAMILALIIALPIGVYSASRRGGILDVGGRTFAFIGMAAPIFWTGIMAILIFSVKLHLLPAGGRDGIASLIMPAATMGWVAAAGLLRLTRSSMIDVLNFDYIKMARAKGLSEGVVLWKHGFKNAALPVLTFFVLLFILIIGSAVITETVFSWPGVGRLLITAVVTRDYPLVQTIVVLLCFLYIGANLLVDVLYGLLNPKIRYQS
jgi:peptide/nickel transport system permease protein